jgi:hypothetical protein
MSLINVLPQNRPFTKTMVGVSFSQVLSKTARLFWPVFFGHPFQCQPAKLWKLESNEFNKVRRRPPRRQFKVMLEKVVWRKITCLGEALKGGNGLLFIKSLKTISQTTTHRIVVV